MTQPNPEEDEKLTDVILGMFEPFAKVGKDITREKLEAWFAGRPELVNLKTAMVAFFREALRDRH